MINTPTDAGVNALEFGEGESSRENCFLIVFQGKRSKQRERNFPWYFVRMSGNDVICKNFCYAASEKTRYGCLQQYILCKINNPLGFLLGVVKKQVIKRKIA